MNARQKVALGVCAGLFIWTTRLAVQAAMPTWLAALLLPASASLILVAATHGRPRRHGFWLVLLSILVGLPLLGAYSLVDPWETHYAEVAREMLERRDFLSPWWAHQSWFMSKPVLLFWLEAPSMWLFGVHTGPDAVVWDASRQVVLHPEYAVRLPGFALSIVGMYILYNGVSRVVNRRAGMLAALVLSTSAGYALLAHQALTDMPLLASIAAACGLLLRALDTKDDAVAPADAGSWLAAVLLLFTVPQLAILLSAHVHVDSARTLGFAFDLDHLRAGSPHACTLPGQPACAEVALAHPALQPFVQMVIWTPAIAWLAWSLARETRLSRLFALAAWTAAAFGTMAKGPAALAIPAAGCVAALLSRRSLRPLLSLEIPRGLGIACVMVLPWYLAVYARHGVPFLDELVLRNMFGRTLDHLHDTNGGEDTGLAYFVKELGYATFPWSGIAAVAMLAAPARRDDRARAGHARALLFGSALAAYALVSSMGTKFHHYGLIALPGIAGVAGMWLDEQLHDATSRRSASRRWSNVLLFITAAVITALVARDFVPAAADHVPSGAARFFHLLTYRYDRRWISTAPYGKAIGAFGVLVAIVVTAQLGRRFRARATVGLALLASSFAAALSVYLVVGAHDGGQRGILEAFYRARTNDPHATSPVIAYELNWKGENFYTANDVAIFISGGAPMRSYLDGLRAKNEGTVFVITERGRLGGLKADLGNVHSYNEVGDRDVSDEFALVRVEP